MRCFFKFQRLCLKHNLLSVIPLTLTLQRESRPLFTLAKYLLPEKMLTGLRDCIPYD